MSGNKINGPNSQVGRVKQSRNPADNSKQVAGEAKKAELNGHTIQVNPTQEFADAGQEPVYKEMLKGLIRNRFEQLIISQGSGKKDKANNPDQTRSRG